MKRLGCSMFVFVDLSRSALWLQAQAKITTFDPGRGHPLR